MAQLIPARFILLLCVIEICSVGVDAQFGSFKTHIDPISFALCPDTEHMANVNINLQENAGEKFADLSFSHDVDLNEEWQFEITMKVWEDNAWQDKPYDYGGFVCKALNEHMPKVWKKLQESAGVSEDCELPQGSYEVNHFHIAQDEFTLPIPLQPGRYLFTAIIKDENQAQMICEEITVDVKEA